MTAPQPLNLQRYYTSNHEWIDLIHFENDYAPVARCGLTHRLLQEFFEVSYLAFLPLEGFLDLETPFAIFETTKAAFELCTPLVGFFSAANLPMTQKLPELLQEPEAPHHWLLEITLSSNFTIPSTWRAHDATPP
jgi:glycine cleavage system H lipoate-binding protein